MRFKNNYIEKLKQYILDKGFTYHIDTMGCSMNENDSSKYAGVLEDIGFKLEKEESKANLILFNTCTVRENAENTLFGRLGYLKSRKLKNKDVYIVVVGCMTQQKDIIEKISKSYPYTDIVLGTNAIGSFPEKLYKCIVNKKKILEYTDVDENVLEDVPVIFEDKYRATVSIIYGCNNFCSYCIVPYVRGKERSRLKENIIYDIVELAKKGYKEITLLGQNVNSYGKDFGSKIDFSDLLQEIEKIDGIEVIKFMSPHPKDFTDKLIDVIAKSKKIYKVLHLPLQSGSDKILDLMNRKYTKEKYLSIVKQIREKCDDIYFSTDIIVGFPGETKEDFAETLQVINEVGFDQIFMYIYSKRSGTKAANMEDITPYKEKVSRLKEIKELSKKIIYENNEKMLGKTYDVLIEGKSKNNDKYYTGRTNTNKIVIFDANESDVGKVVKVKILKNNLWYLTGQIL